MNHEYKRICKDLGHKIKVFTQVRPRFNKVMGSPDGIIIFTNTVSHKMANIAMGEAKKSSIPVIRCHTSSKYALNNKIKELEGIVS